jgi:superfamily II DNA helicase RecQ
MHEFFFERDYPDVELLRKVHARCAGDPRAREVIRRAAGISVAEFEKACERLEMLGVCASETDGSLFRLEPGAAWPEQYAAQVMQRRQQIEAMQRFAESNQCRMAALVRHFGDATDRSPFCGQCDVCAPEHMISQQLRPLTPFEEKAAQSVLRELRGGSAKSTGKLHRELFPRDELSRDAFEAVLGAMVSAGYLFMEDASFEVEGRSIPFRRVGLTRDGESLAVGDLGLLRMREALTGGSVRSGSRRVDKTKTAGNRSSTGDEVSLNSAETELEQKLRLWRAGEARKYGFPAYRVFSDKTMRAIVLDRPVTVEDLRTVDGIGPATAARFGEEICRICAEA